MAKLTTHILDTTSGKPATGLSIDLYQRINNQSILIKTIKSNKDGRCDEPLLDDTNIGKSGYELVFNVEKYFQNKQMDAKFLKDVIIRFYIDDPAQNYHVPLLISPYSYSTYKGS